MFQRSSEKWNFATLETFEIAGRKNERACRTALKYCHTQMDYHRVWTTEIHVVSTLHGSEMHTRIHLLRVAFLIVTGAEMSGWVKLVVWQGAPSRSRGNWGGNIWMLSKCVYLWNGVKGFKRDSTVEWLVCYCVLVSWPSALVDGPITFDYLEFRMRHYILHQI